MKGGLKEMENSWMLADKIDPNIFFDDKLHIPFYMKICKWFAWECEQS